MTDSVVLLFVSVESRPGMRRDKSVRLPACAGLAGASRGEIAARADRDLFFQDSYLDPGWGFAPAALTPAHFD
jgi:hypothetical protein